MNKNIKYLIETTYKFNPIDYNDIEDDEILSKDEISRTTHKYFPTTYYELEEICTDHFINHNYDLTDIDVSNITDFSYLFRNNIDANKIDVSNWDVSNGTCFRFMFADNKEFTADLSNWNVSKGVNFDYMFENCTSFDYTTIQNWDFSSCKSAINMFFNVDHFLKVKMSYGKNAKQYLTIQKIKQVIGEKRNQYAPCFFPTDNHETAVIVMKLLNEGVSNLNMIDVSNITDLSYIFSDYPYLQDIDISQWNVSNCKNFSHMFYNAISFNGDLSNWDVSNGKDFSYMFSKTKIKFDISKWNMLKGKNFEGMLQDCYALICNFKNMKQIKGVKYNNMFKGSINVIKPDWYEDD